MRVLCLLVLTALVSIEKPAVPVDDLAREERAPGIRIERAPPDAEHEAALHRLRAWRALYVDRLAAVRRSAATLFNELRHSSLATLSDRCRGLRARLSEIDRGALFPAPDVEIDRMLFGALERFRAGAAACLGRRYLASYRLLLEARAGLEWVDRWLDRRLAPPLRLPGLGPPDDSAATGTGRGPERARAPQTGPKAQRPDSVTPRGDLPGLVAWQGSLVLPVQQGREPAPDGVPGPFPDYDPGAWRRP